jgi:two-component system, NarL family, sensor histidine kinase DegS
MTLHTDIHLNKTWLLKAKELSGNVHFWAIGVLITGITAIYYINGFNDYVHWFWRFRAFEFVYDINGCLLYVPFIYAILVFGLPGILIAWIFSILIMLPQLIYSVPNGASLLANMMFLLIPTLVFSLVVLASRWLQREKESFAERERERQAYMLEVFKAQEEERKHIARELHDDTIQTLLAIANRIQALTKQEPDTIPLRVKQQLELFGSSIFRVSEDLRKLSLELRPSILDDIGLIEAIRSLADKTNEDSINAKFLINGEPRLLTKDAEAIVFRFVQEALNNVRRHAEASEVIINLDFGLETVKITVRDNGKGFILPQPLSQLTARGKLGLTGMQEKAKLIHGTFYVHSDPGKGALVALEFKTPKVEQQQERKVKAVTISPIKPESEKNFL